MSRKKFGSNRGWEPCSGNQLDSSDMGQRYRMLVCNGQQFQSWLTYIELEFSGTTTSSTRKHEQHPFRAPIQFHSAYSNTNISNPTQFFIPTPHMWPPVSYPNYVPTPQTSTLNHFSHVTPHMWPLAPNSNFASTLNNFSLAAPHMWAPAANPYFAAHQGARSPFVCLPHHNGFRLQPVLVPCHPYLMHPRPPYGRGRPVSSRQHALHNGGIVPTDPDVPTTSARQADDVDYLAPPFHARYTPAVQTPREGCQRDVSSLPREKYSEVTSTSASQANHADPTRNHLSTPTKAAVADKGPVASIAADEKTAHEKSRAPGLVASSQFVLQWLGGTEIRISKSPDSAATLCELPTNESVFYEWWEVAPTSSHPQSIVASLGLEVRESWDGLNLMREGLSKSSDDAPSSPQSVLASENLEKYSEGSDVTETSIDQLRKMLGITLGNPSDISCIMSSLIDVGAKLTEDSDVPTTSAREADGVDYSAPYFHARDTPVVQIPKEGCQRGVSSLPRVKYSRVTATSASQANHADPTQNHSSTPTKAAFADKGLVASITADEKTANDKSRAPGLVASSQFVLQWLGGTEIRISKSPDSAPTLCELPTNESVFYEWWEVTPTSSHPQSVLASLGLEVRESWDGLNLMLEGLSESSYDTPLSPQSVLASENLEKYSKEGSNVTETSIDQLRKMLGISLGNRSDISCIMSSLFDVGAELTEDLTEELTAKKK